MFVLLYFIHSSNFIHFVSYIYSFIVDIIRSFSSKFVPPIEYSNRSVAALQKIHIAELLITSVVNQYSALCVVDYSTSIVEYI